MYLRSGIFLVVLLGCLVSSSLSHKHRNRSEPHVDEYQALFDSIQQKVQFPRFGSSDEDSFFSSNGDSDDEGLGGNGMFSVFTQLSGTLLPTACKKDSDCSDNQTCSRFLGKCVASRQQQQQNCSNDSDCKSVLNGTVICAGGNCRVCGADVCTNDSDCCPGETCSNYNGLLSLTRCRQDNTSASGAVAASAGVAKAALKPVKNSAKNPKSASSSGSSSSSSGVSSASEGASSNHGSVAAKKSEGSARTRQNSGYAAAQSSDQDSASTESSQVDTTESTPAELGTTEVATTDAASPATVVPKVNPARQSGKSARGRQRPAPPVHDEVTTSSSVSISGNISVQSQSNDAQPEDLQGSNGYASESVSGAKATKVAKKAQKGSQASGAASSSSGSAAGQNSNSQSSQNNEDDSGNNDLNIQQQDTNSSQPVQGLISGVAQTNNGAKNSRRHEKFTAHNDARQQSDVSVSVNYGAPAGIVRTKTKSHPLVGPANPEVLPASTTQAPDNSSSSDYQQGPGSDDNNNDANNGDQLEVTLYQSQKPVVPPKVVVASSNGKNSNAIFSAASSSSGYGAQAPVKRPPAVQRQTNKY